MKGSKGETWRAMQIMDIEYKMAGHTIQHGKYSSNGTRQTCGSRSNITARSLAIAITAYLWHEPWPTSIRKSRLANERTDLSKY